MESPMLDREHAYLLALDGLFESYRVFSMKARTFSL